MHLNIFWYFISENSFIILNVIGVHLLSSLLAWLQSPLPSDGKGRLSYIERRKTQRYYNDCKSLTCLLIQSPQLPHSGGSLSSKGRARWAFLFAFPLAHSLRHKEKQLLNLTGAGSTSCTESALWDTQKQGV